MKLRLRLTTSACSVCKWQEGRRLVAIIGRWNSLAGLGQLYGLVCVMWQGELAVDISSYSTGDTNYKLTTRVDTPHTMTYSENFKSEQTSHHPPTKTVLSTVTSKSKWVKLIKRGGKGKFSKGWQGCSERCPEGGDRGKSWRAGLPVRGKPRPSNFLLRCPFYI